MKDAAELKSHVYDIVGALHSVHDELGPDITIERYFYDTDNREILASDGNPFQSRQMGTGELARAPKASCFK